MIILQVEHRVPDFGAWKKAFDGDPIDRKSAGVKRYRVYRAKNDPDNVMIDLEFENLESAETALNSLKALWSKLEGTVINSPSTRLLDLVDSKEYS